MNNICHKLKHPTTAIILIVLLALGLRLALWSQPLHQPANDEIEYIAVARDLLAGQGWIYYDTYRWLRAPLYPLFLAGSLWLAGGDLHNAALPNILLSTLNVALAYALTRALVGQRPAPLAALLTAILWTNATFGSLYMAETLFTTLFCAALLLTLHANHSRRPLLTTALAGACYGLAALTRSAILPFLPLAAIWLSLNLARRFPATRIPRAGIILLLTALAVIAPWTIHNASAYGRPILIETGLSYNLWAFNEPREDLDTIHRTLEQIPNPADRSDYATARGLERLREDPAILARKLWPNFVYLTRVKPIQDRFLMANYYDSIDLPLFVATLIFDDALYILIALAAIAGLILFNSIPRSIFPLSPAWERGSGGERLLILAWILLTIGSMLLTHGEARYRHFLFPVLIPYAAWAIRRPTSAPIRWFQPIAITGIWLIFIWTIATSYPRDWAVENIARGWPTLIGDLDRLAGRNDAAAAAYERAAAAQASPEPLLRLGDLARYSGNSTQALSAYRAARRLNPIYESSAALLGDLLRAQGNLEEARAAFRAAYLDPQYLADWSWRELPKRIELTPRSAINIGDDLDYGYINGFFPAETIQATQARWSGAHASIRLSFTQPGSAILTLRMAAPHPGQPSVPVQICAASQCQIINVGPTWRSYTLPISVTNTAPIELSIPTFTAADGRQLGILLDSISVRAYSYTRQQP
jgi:4-amino-4-deoxy-L-arabinose transferase-like glycosyltransferase